MRPGINQFILDVDRSTEGLLKDASGNLIVSNDKPLFLSTHFEEYRHVTQRGNIHRAPKQVHLFDDHRRQNFYDFKLKDGGVVYFHHYAVHPDAQITIDEKKFYLQEYEQLYAVEHGDEIIPLEEHIFIEPLYETDDDIKKAGVLIKPVPGLLTFHGKLRYINQRCSEKYNVKEGDNIIFRSGAEYRMLIKNEILYSTKAHLILAKYEH